MVVVLSAIAGLASAAIAVGHIRSRTAGPVVTPAADAGDDHRATVLEGRLSLAPQVPSR